MSLGRLRSTQGLEVTEIPWAVGWGSDEEMKLEKWVEDETAAHPSSAFLLEQMLYSIHSLLG